MAKNTSSLCLVSAMDHLWYHHIILGSDPFSTFVDHTTSPFAKFPSCPSPSSSLPFSSSMDETTTLPSSSSSHSVSSDEISFVSQEDCSNEQTGKRQPIEEFEKSNKIKFSEGRKMNKSRSCKSLGELEIEEVKGFMDLGFEFKRENLSPQMVKLLPGLQRLKTPIDKRNCVEEDHDEDEDENENEEISRPYLSEAWTLKRTNFHLLNLRMPKVSSACDMKKHLKSWAKTVASEIH